MKHIYEFEVDKKFKDALKISRERLDADLNAEIDKYKKELEACPDSGYYKYFLNAAEKQLKDRNYVYNDLAKKGLDVEKSTIQYIGKGSDFSSQTLKKKIKEKLPLVKNMDDEQKSYYEYTVFLIADTHINYMQKGGIYVWRASWTFGKLELQDESNFDGSVMNSNIPERSLMMKLNKGLIDDWDFYLAFGVSNYEKIEQRELNKANENYSFKSINEKIESILNEISDKTKQ